MEEQEKIPHEETKEEFRVVAFSKKGENFFAKTKMKMLRP